MKKITKRLVISEKTKKPTCDHHCSHHNPFPTPPSSSSSSSSQYYHNPNRSNPTMDLTEKITKNPKKKILKTKMRRE